MLNSRRLFRFNLIKVPGLNQCFETSWQFDENFPYLAGHFPDQPLLPAVAAVDGSIELLRLALGNDDIQPQSVFNAKFTAAITPGLPIKIRLQLISESKWRADWTSTTSDGETLLLARIGLLL